jgi:membrane-bound inhibitor of C-type lysozyme
MDLRQWKVVVLATGVCAGCGGPPTQGDRVERPGERVIELSCRDGEQVLLRFHDAPGVADLTRAGRTIRLKQQASESGFVYSDGRNTVRGKGRDVTLALDRAEPIRCRNQGGSD